MKEASPMVSEMDTESSITTKAESTAETGLTVKCTAAVLFTILTEEQHIKANGVMILSTAMESSTTKIPIKFNPNMISAISTTLKTSGYSTKANSSMMINAVMVLFT